ncbi:MAG: hypothetical protein GF411_06090 [Candidatus Lokiarchaeota archaeon]|nr:hypothetical protein [Candidatus Lokiarchaeota archaeon]
MTDDEIRPSVVLGIYSLEKKMKKVGLTYEQIIFLIQKELRKGRRKPPSLKSIKETLRAAKKIEKQLLS